MLLSLLLLPVILSQASPTSTPAHRDADSDSHPELLLRYHHETGSNQTEFSLSTQDKADVYAHVCGDTLEVAGKTMTMRVNERGSGNVIVDDKTYRVVGNRQESGGASCTKMYTESSTVVECSVPWRHSFEELPALPADDIDECFSTEAAARRRNLPRAFSSPFTSTHSGIDKRWLDPGCSPVAETVKLVGDGNPHQDIFHKQVGASQTCAQKGNCFVGVGEEVSITVSAEIGGAGGWITGGFGVSKTVSSSTERGCYGEVGDTVCQWSRTHHTAYTVRTSDRTLCGAFLDEKWSDPYVIRSPNEGSQAVEWYCVVNTCRGDGDHYWELGRAGGP